jgi:hypothetical protein
VQRDNEAAFQPRFPSAIGTQQLWHWLNGRFDWQHIETRAGKMAGTQCRFDLREIEHGTTRSID